MNERAVTIVLRWLLPGALMALTVVPWAVAWSDLPDPVATHWGLDGEANGKMSRPAAAGFLAVLGGAFCVGLSRSGRRPGQGRRISQATLATTFGAALAAFVSLGTVTVNHGEPTWRVVELPFERTFLFAGAALLVTVCVAGLKQLVPIAGDTAAASRPRTVAVVSPGERVAWVGAASGRWNRLIAVGGVLATIGLLLAGSGMLAVATFLAAVVFGEISRVRVTVGRAGVRVSAPLGWPKVAIPVDHIREATTVDVHPADWGGWGYRGGLRLGGSAAWIVRAGPGVRLDLADGGTFVVTVDDADAAASVVNALVPSSAELEA